MNERDRELIVFWFLIGKFLKQDIVCRAMVELPETAQELQEQIQQMEFEFVGDIGSENVFGVSVTGKLEREDGSQISVIGSLPLNINSGGLKENKSPDVLAYPDGMIESPVVLLEGDEAIEFFEDNFTHTDHDSPYQSYSDVDIDSSAL